MINSAVNEGMFPHFETKVVFLNIVVYFFGICCTHLAIKGAVSVQGQKCKNLESMCLSSHLRTREEKKNSGKSDCLTSLP